MQNRERLEQQKMQNSTNKAKEQPDQKLKEKKAPSQPSITVVFTTQHILAKITRPSKTTVEAYYSELINNYPPESRKPLLNEIEFKLDGQYLSPRDFLMEDSLSIDFSTSIAPSPDDLIYPINQDKEHHYTIYGLASNVLPFTSHYGKYYGSLAFVNDLEYASYYLSNALFSNYRAYEIQILLSEIADSDDCNFTWSNADQSSVSSQRLHSTLKSIGSTKGLSITINQTYEVINDQGSLACISGMSLYKFNKTPYQPLMNICTPFLAKDCYLIIQEYLEEFTAPLVDIATLEKKRSPIAPATIKKFIDTETSCLSFQSIFPSVQAPEIQKLKNNDETEKNNFSVFSATR